MNLKRPGAPLPPRCPPGSPPASPPGDGPRRPLGRTSGTRFAFDYLDCRRPDQGIRWLKVLPVGQATRPAGRREVSHDPQHTRTSTPTADDGPARASHRGDRRSGRRPVPVRVVLRQEPRQVRQVRLAHLRDGPLRHLLLPGARRTPRTGGRLRRERVPAVERRSASRSGVQRPARGLQDAQRVRAAEHLPRRQSGRGRSVR